MNAYPKFPDSQRANLLSNLRGLLTRQVEEESLSFDRAFIHVALDILGYDPDTGTIADGKGDYGVDFWIVGERSSTIFQFKSQDFVSSPLDDKLLFGPDLTSDLARLYDLLQNLDDPPSEGNAKVTAFVRDLRAAIHRYSQSEESKSDPYQITVYYCALAGGLTMQAQDEYSKLAVERTYQWMNQNINVDTRSVFIDSLLAEGWREENTDWRDAKGAKNDTITLHVRGQMIETPKSLVFFASAEDLVAAFDTFGYQIFEPNVRCELKRSRVNEAIKESVKTSRGRKEFKHLNNGITLICANFRKVKRNQAEEVDIKQPGVINGLQTVKSIHDAYDDLNGRERQHFSQNCDILIRLHTRNAVHDYKELVKSTNNQNPMQPRPPSFRKTS
jgi:AIPR protein